MRWFWYLLGALVLGAAALLLTLHVRREALALEFANQALAGSGLVVVDLSIARLRPDEIRFRRLELAAAAGTRYELEGLLVPLALPDTAIRSAHVSRVRVTPAAVGEPGSEPAGEPPDLSGLLDTVFALPLTFPELTVTVGAVDWPGWPPLEHLTWRTGGGEQELEGTVAGIEVRLSTGGAPTRSARPAQRVSLSAAGGAAAADLLFEPAAPGYAVRGAVTFTAGPWLALAREAEWLPWPGLDAIAAGRAELNGKLGQAGLVLAARVALEDGSRLGVSDAAAGIGAEVLGLGAVDVEATFPGREWSVRAQSFKIRVEHPALSEATADVDEVECVTARCRFAGTAMAGAVEAGGLRTAAVTAAASGSLAFADGWSVTAVPTAFAAAEVRGDGWRAGRLRLRDSREFVVAISPAGLRATADGISADVDGLTVAGSLTAAARVELAALEFDGALGPAFEAQYELPKDTLHLAVNGRAVVPPALRGRVDLTGALGTARVSAADSGRDLDVEIDVVVAPGRVAATVRRATIGFETTPLSGSLPGWRLPFDLAGGSAAADGALEWRQGDGILTGEFRIVLADAAGTWQDLAATGMHAEMPVRFLPGRPPVLGPGTAGAAFVDVGLPLRDVAARMAWDTASPVVRVEDFTVGLLGGTLGAAPFGFDTAAMRGTLVLEVDGLQLGLIPELAEFEALELTGSLSGTVPVSIEAGTVTITDGHLENDPPGGVIRYHAAAATDGQGGLAMAQRALSHLRYDSLTSDVSYTETGDLVMKLRLEGINPDMDPLQPVILNLSVENNIPQLLESLQATRDIQDIIERRTDQRPALPR